MPTAGARSTISSLDIADGEFLVLVGPSGCGKSTALRMIAGLEDITAGRLAIGGVLANALSPRQRNVAMIFQSYALYPHLERRRKSRLRAEGRASAPGARSSGALARPRRCWS